MHLASDDIAPLLRALGQPMDAAEVTELRRAFGLEEDTVSGLTYFESSSHGITLVAQAGRVRSVFLFAHGKDDFQRYKGSLPLGITFYWNKERVREALGPPAESGSAEHVSKGLGHPHGGWDKYVFAECSLHLTYAPGNGRIQLVTLEVEE